MVAAVASSLCVDMLASRENFRAFQEASAFSRPIKRSPMPRSKRSKPEKPLRDLTDDEVLEKLFPPQVVEMVRDTLAELEKPVSKKRILRGATVG